MKRAFVRASTAHVGRLGACVTCATLALARGAAAAPATRPATAPSFFVGHIDHPPIAESSGIVASQKYPGVYWTHNDSGNAPVLYAITREGKLVAEFPVDAPNRDWEDIALDEAGQIYIGDIGNNNAHFAELHVYRVDEPDPTVPQGKHRPPLAPLRVTASWTLRFPDRPFDCESLFVWKGEGYVISKRFNFAAATVYHFALGAGDDKEPITLAKVIDLPIRAPVTAADLSADGQWLAVMSVAGPYLFRVDGDVASAGKVRPAHATFLHPKMEAVCFIPEGLLATTEDRDVLLFRYEDFTGGPTPTTHPGTK